MTTKTPNNLRVDLKDLEVKIEKYPMAESPNLIENFLILGYEDTYCQEVLIKNLQTINVMQEFEKTDNKMRKGSEGTKFFLKEYKCRNFPTILGSISSNFTGGIFDGNQIIEKVFPVPPSAYFGIVENYPNEPTNVVFSNIQNNVVNIGYGFIFYETKIYTNKLKIYLPKAFVVISQYPFFNIFSTLCKEVKKLYNNEQLQIPIEIQIYNIVNFVPAPINSSMKMTLIPAEELFEINRCKNKEEFFNLKKQEQYLLAQLSGYRCSDINFSELFSVLSVETIVEVYLELLSGKIIGFFSKYIEILNLTMYIFQQFFFPLAPNENVAGLSPIKFYCSENVDQYIVGFVCTYEDLDKYNPFREIKPGEYRCLSDVEEKSDLDPLVFKCDYILDLDKKILKEQDYDSEEKNKQNKILNEYFKKVISGSATNSLLDKAIVLLLGKLKEISYKLTSYQHNKDTMPKFFVCNDSNETLNRSILDTFYQFNLTISFLYYTKVSSYNGDYRTLKENQDINIKSKEDSGLNDDEYLFFSSFSNSLYCNVLGNFVGGYSDKEPIIYKTPRRIFELLLSIKKLYNKDDFFQYILDIYDSVYNIKDPEGINSNSNASISKEKNSKNFKLTRAKEIKIDSPTPNSEILGNKEDKYKTIITFLEFYKYYFTSPNIASYFYNISNNEFVYGNLNKNNKQNIKYTYKYKKIDFDQNIILKYIYLIKQMDENTRKRCFKLTDEDTKIEHIISSNYISSSIEQFYINSKLIDYKDLIKYCILGVVALSASEHKMLHFYDPICSILRSLKFSIRKITEIILSISLRLFSREKEKNLFIYEKYFNLYKELEKRQIFPNDELIILEKKIDEFTQSIKDTRKEVSQEEYNKLMKTEEKKRYTLKYDEKKAKEIKAPSYSFGVNEINKLKISFDTKKTGKKSFDSTYSFITMYDSMSSLLNIYSKDLDSSKINKEEYNKLILYLLYYATILEFSKETSLFLFYCLDLDVIKGMKFKN